MSEELENISILIRISVETSLVEEPHLLQPTRLLPEDLDHDPDLPSIGHDITSISLNHLTKPTLPQLLDVLKVTTREVPERLFCKYTNEMYIAV